MAPLTLTTLRHLARLYRAEVEGADEALAHLLREHCAELSTLLGVSPDAVEAVASRENAIDTLVAAIENAPRAARHACERAAHASAQALAQQLAERAETRGDHYVLDVVVLDEMLATFRGRVVTFSDRGSVGAVRLRALVRQLRGANVAAAVGHEHLVLVYRGDRVRGVVRLVLHEPVLESALLVPLGVRASVERVDHLPTTREARTEAARTRGFVLRFVEALTSVVFGGRS
jgi:hypothetical protein